MPEVSAGIRDLRVLKTTQSSFVDFVDDEYRALPFMEDRLLSTVVTGDWSYSRPLGGQRQYDDAFNKVRDTILGSGRYGNLLRQCPELSASDPDEDTGDNPDHQIRYPGLS